MIEVRHIDNENDLELAMGIRHVVFVVEQKVPEEEEYDQHERSAQHYLALYNGKPAGTARWRISDSGIKLERFCTLKEYRKKGVASSILNQILKEVKKIPLKEEMHIYLHSQLPVLNFYQKFGFEKSGNLFQECDIDHYKMILR